MSTLSVTEARATLPELLDRVADGEEITITRHGKPVAVVLRPDAVRSRRAAGAIEHAQKIGDLLTAARDRPLPDIGVSKERAKQLVEDVRFGRDRS
ncbi:MAG: type II toxin-antitoxin system Phd/YefM family antitoxin [Candidatus Limnocylindria bacterium]